jgi:hypothetical protein
MIVRELVLCAWLALTAAAFWGPYLGWDAGTPGLVALYGLFLVTAVVVSALRSLRGTETNVRGGEEAAQRGQ